MTLLLLQLRLPPLQWLGDAVADQGTAPQVPTTVKGNFTGTLAGAAATVAVGFLAQAGYLATAAAFIGVPEATVSILAMAVIGGAFNYGVTHVAVMQNLNTLYKSLPTTYAEYPDPKGLEGRSSEDN